MGEGCCHSIGTIKIFSWFSKHGYFWVVLLVVQRHPAEMGNYI